jgi:hypothetical protein
MSNRVILVAESDQHGGNSLGLLNPDTELISKEKKKYHPTLSETQNHLWRIRSNAVEQIKYLAGKSKIFLLELGDVNQGMVYEVDNGLASQIEIAVSNMQPWLSFKNLAGIRIDSGTSAHSFGDGDAEELLVARLKDRRFDLNIETTNHGISNIAGVLVDHAHHGPSTGSREWLKGNVALYYLKDIMMKDILRGRVPPHLVLRGHYHAVVEVFNRITGSNGVVYRSWLWVLPSLCGLNGHALKITKSEYEITNGIVAWEIIDGKIRESFEFSEVFDARDREVLL